MSQISDGNYVILFNFFDTAGRLLRQERVGSFTVRADAVKSADGIARGMIPVGPISGPTETRIFYGLNTGYYEVRREQSFRARTLQKSAKWRIKIRGHLGWHPIKTITPPDHMEGKNTYVLEDGTMVHQDQVEDLDIADEHGEYSKLVKSLHDDIRARMDVAVDRDHDVSPIAAYSADGTRLFMDRGVPSGVEEFVKFRAATARALTDRLGYSVDGARRVANTVERHAVENSGIDYQSYADLMNGRHSVTSPAIDVDPEEDMVANRWSGERLGKSEDTNRVASIAVLDTTHGTVLMGRRADNQKMTLPGGHLKQDETPEEGAKRELLEETGIAAKKLEFLGSKEVVNEEGKSLMIFAYKMEVAKPPQASSELDPDEEVQEWDWIGTGRELQSMADQQHVPFEKNVVFEHLKLNRSRLAKADEIAATSDTAEADGFAVMMDRVASYDPTITAEEIDRVLRGPRWGSAITKHNEIFHLPAWNEDHTRAVAERFDSLDPVRRDDFSHIEPYMYQTVPIPDDILDTKIREAKQWIEESDRPEEIQKQRENITHLNYDAVLKPLVRNKHVSSEVLGQIHDIVKGHMDRMALTPYFAKPPMTWGKNHRLETTLNLLLRNPRTPPEALAQHAKGPLRNLVAENPNTPAPTLQELAADKNKHIRLRAQNSLRVHGHEVGGDNLDVTVGVNRLREIRDFVMARGDKIHSNELKGAGWDLGQLGLGHLKDGTGHVSHEAVQGLIDRTPKMRYNVSHSQYGFDYDTDYSDPYHPDHDYYDIEQDEDGYPIPSQVPDPGDEQRHSDVPSQVLQVNVTPDHIQQMKEAGVWDTFKDVAGAARMASHPGAGVGGIGWIRYTTRTDAPGYFVDEVQTDLGHALSHKITEATKRAQTEGEISDEEARQAIGRSRALQPPEHYKKINEILFGGKKPEEVLHETFHEYVRQKSGPGTPVHVWQKDPKLELNNSKDNAAMHRTYDQIPQKMGMVPASYGDLKTQYNKKHADKPTWAINIRKSESLQDVIQVLRDEDSTDSKEFVSGLIRQARRHQEWEVRHLDPATDIELNPIEEKSIEGLDIETLRECQPIVVIPGRQGKYQILDGNHRAYAAWKFNTTIKAYVPKPMTATAPKPVPSSNNGMNKSAWAINIRKSDRRLMFELLGKSEQSKLSFPIGTEKLREVRDFIDANGGTMNGKDVEKRHNLSSMGLAHLKDGKGSVTSERVQQHIDSLPRVSFLTSLSKFGDDPTKSPAHPNHPLHNYYKQLYAAQEGAGEIPDPLAAQMHDPAVPSQVLQINLTPDHIKKMKEAGVYSTYQRMNSASVQSGHPVGEGNGMGWIRFSKGPDGIFVDEIQTDLAQSYRKTFEKQAELAQQVGMMDAERAESYRQQMARAFPEEHQDKIREIVFGDKHPSQILHDAFHHWARQNGHAGQPIHVWATEGKRQAVLSDLDAAAPAHMQVTYSQTPRRMGYEPAQYGELSVQTGPHAGKQTQKTILKKARKLLFDILRKADAPVPPVGEHLNHITGTHPWSRRNGKDLDQVEFTHPEVAQFHDDHVEHHFSKLLDKAPDTHKHLLQALYDRVKKCPARHVRMGWEQKRNKPKERHYGLRIRQFKALVDGSPDTRLEFIPRGIMIHHSPHGDVPIGKQRWRFTLETGLEHLP